jgi:hypothetical protein
MPQRPSTETIEVLFRTLLEVEQQLDPVSDAASIAELKRIVLQRIAVLEIERAREPQIASLCDSPPPTAADGDISTAGSAPDLLPPTRAA